MERVTNVQSLYLSKVSKVSHLTTKGHSATVPQLQSPGLPHGACIVSRWPVGPPREARPVQSLSSLSAPQFYQFHQFHQLLVRGRLWAILSSVPPRTRLGF